LASIQGISWAAEINSSLTALLTVAFKLTLVLHRYDVG